MQEVLSLHTLLESCEFKQFWIALRENQELVELVSNTEEAVRNCESESLSGGGGGGGGNLITSGDVM